MIADTCALETAGNSSAIAVPAAHDSAPGQITGSSLFCSAKRMYILASAMVPGDRVFA